MNRLRSLKSPVTPVKSTSISLKKLKERIREFAGANKLRLQSLFSDQVVNDLARELGHDFRERVFDPATTLGLYIAQVLNRDEPCSTVVNVLAYNLIALLLCDAAEVTELHPRQLSFSHARDTFIHFGAERMSIRDLEWLILQTSQFQIKNRPRREEPREIKKRNGKYPRLKQPRPSKKAKLSKEKQAPAA